MDDFDDVLNADLNRYLDTLEEPEPEPDPDWMTPKPWEKEAE